MKPPSIPLPRLARTACLSLCLGSLLAAIPARADDDDHDHRHHEGFFHRLFHGHDERERPRVVEHEARGTIEVLPSTNAEPGTLITVTPAEAVPTPPPVPARRISERPPVAPPTVIYQVDRNEAPHPYAPPGNVVREEPQVRVHEIPADEPRIVQPAPPAVTTAAPAPVIRRNARETNENVVTSARADRERATTPSRKEKETARPKKVIHEEKEQTTRSEVVKETPPPAPEKPSQPEHAPDSSPPPPTNTLHPENPDLNVSPMAATETPATTKSVTESKASIAPLPSSATSAKKDMKGKKELAPPTHDGNYPVAQRSERSGFVKSPYPPFNELDASGLLSGSIARDPTTGKVFRVP